MKLRYFKKDNKKIYTLKEKVDNKATEDAHCGGHMLAYPVRLLIYWLRRSSPPAPELEA